MNSMSWEETFGISVAGKMAQTGMHLTNFKAFCKETAIPIAPITLIFGQNSSGKSSILQAILLLKQTLENLQANSSLLPNIDGGYVDLGTFNNLTSQNSESETLEIGFEFRYDSGELPPYFITLEEACGSGPGDEIRRFETIDNSQLLKGVISYCSTDNSIQISALRLELDGKELATFSTVLKSESSNKYGTTLEGKWEQASRLKLRKLDPTVGQFMEHYNKVINKNRSELEKILILLREVADAYIKESANLDEKLHLKDIQAGVWTHSSNASKSVYNAEYVKNIVQRLLSLITTSDETHLHDLVREMESEGFVLLSMLEISPRGQIVHDLISEGLYPGRYFIDSFCYSEIHGYDNPLYDEQYAKARVAAPVFFEKLGLLQDALQHFRGGLLEWHEGPGKRMFPSVYSYIARHLVSVKGFLNSVVPIGPFREAPQRYYFYRGAAPASVEFDGGGLPHILFDNENLLGDVNKWLEQLQTGYQLSIKHTDQDDPSVFKLELVDTRQNPPVRTSLHDVGYGISQLLPLIVQSLAGKNKTITIEQPEVHIHPRLQADLGDLLAHSIQEPLSNRFIIETHSEHLVLRMQKLVRTGKLKPDDVAILYVSRGEDGSTVERLRLDDEGDFLDEWPGGFFPERLREFD